MMSFFSAKGDPIWIKFPRLVQNDMSTAVIWSKSKPGVEFQYGGRLGEFSGMPSQSEIALQGPATWWIHSHDSRATCHIAGCSHLANSMSRSCNIAGCSLIVLSAILKIVFRHILFFCFFNAVWALTSGGSYRLRYTCFSFDVFFYAAH